MMTLRARSLCSLLVLIACVHSASSGGGVTPQAQDGSSSDVHVGPTSGSLVVVGGGQIGAEIVDRFIELAGGKDAPIVVIPTAGGDPDSAYTQSCRCADFLRRAGASKVTILHSYDRKDADREEFAKVLETARGVWFPGGRQWRLADSYLGTRTERALHAVLERGGVIGGTSAGASIQASYLVRGAPEGNTIVMSPGHEQGFGFLRGVAVDQHVIVRSRLSDLPQVLKAHPGLLGIGIDEGTAIVVQGDHFSVIGRSKAFVYGGKDSDAGAQYRTLNVGDRYDMAQRRSIPSAP